MHMIIGLAYKSRMIIVPRALGPEMSLYNSCL
jgi:hypothetical protein